MDAKSRRSSSRSIKRRRFDDEIVESSLSSPPGMPHSLPPINKFSRGRISSLSEPIAGTVPEAPQRRRSKSYKRARRHKHPHTTKDIGRWKGCDDLLLIQAVHQTNDLISVHRGCKFSCKFTLQEVHERWYALLYDPTISRLAIQAVKQLTPEVIAGVEAKALFSKAEEELLGTILPSAHISTEQFLTLLDNNKNTFHRGRTARSLLQHWQLMKHHHLLPEQSVRPLPRGDTVLNLSDAEELMHDAELGDIPDESLEQELAIADRNAKREIRHLENELPKWQVLVDSVKGVTTQDFDNQTLAVLRGRLVRYLMRSKEITIGRSTKTHSVDADLSLEGPAWKISRKQGIIKLQSSGEFVIANEGKRPIYVDGRAILAANKCKLYNNSVIEMECLRFVFLINEELVNVIKQEAPKLPQS